MEAQKISLMVAEFQPKRPKQNCVKSDKLSVEQAFLKAIELIFHKADDEASGGNFNDCQTKSVSIVKYETEPQEPLENACLKYVRYCFDAVYVVAILSLHQTQNFLQTIDENQNAYPSKAVYYNYIIETCCFLLNMKNWNYIKKISGNCKKHWYTTKRNIFKDFLKKKIKGRSRCSEESAAISTFVYQFGSKSLESMFTNLFMQANADVHALQMNMSSIPVNVDIEGRIIEKLCDPPGQKSVYIPPGDTSKEAYRLSTFLRFPQTAPVNPSELALIGFFYTGYKDRVKCFSCAISVEGWMVGDDPKDSRWHRPNCAFIKGEKCGNIRIGIDGWIGSRFNSKSSTLVSKTNNIQQVPSSSLKLSKPSNSVHNGIHSSSYNENNSAGKLRFQNFAAPVSTNGIYKPPAFATIVTANHEEFLKSLDLRREIDRIKSFDRLLSPFNVSPNDLAKSGFFYLGNGDRCQCFSCEGVLRSWSYGDNVANEHKIHFPDCRMVLGIEAYNIPLSGHSVPPSLFKPQIQISSNPNASEQALLYQNFPCLFPMNPHMKEESARLLTFDQRWPASKIHATPLQIVKAGFYFLGERDRVKCWYCNGGLQNWEPMDEPWKEHAKWFPTCEYLLQQKGPDFVHAVVRLFPNLRRPLLRNGFDVPPSTRAANSTPPVSVIDPRIEMQRRKERIEKELDSNVAKMARDMGFSRNSIKKAVEKKISNDEPSFQNLSGLVDALLDCSNSDSDEEIETRAAEVKVKKTATSHIPAETSVSLEERMKQLEDQRQCKICLNSVADVVFVPCGHLCSCISCAQSLRKCPICRVKIEKAIKTYLS